MSSSSSRPNVPLLQFQDVFDAALKEYRHKTGKDIATNPLAVRFLDCKSPAAVLDILEEQARAFDQFRKGDRELMKRLRPIVDILLGLTTSDIIVEGISLIFPPVNAIFAGVGLLLAAAKGVSNSYDALIDLFQCFEHYLARLKVLTEIPCFMGEVLVKIMIELLEVLALATQQISQGRFKKFAKKLLGENDVEAVLQRLDRLTMEESRMTATQTMEVVYGLFNNMKVVMDDGKASIDHIREALVTMQKISDDLNEMKCDRLREKIQKWLSPPDPSINHNAACEAHHNGTATWFLEGLMYSEWKATGSLLWTHGNPGSGKSVLCSSIIKDIESICATGLASVAYYYFDFKDTGKQDRRGLLSSLLNQLCTRSHRGYDILSNLYKAHDYGSRQPSEVDLIQCLKNVLALPRHGKAYIIVDALDESPNKPGIPSPREKVLQLVQDLVDLCHPDIRVCITSRPEVDIRMVLEPLASHTMSLHDEIGQRSDIIDYIKSVVESNANMRKWRPEDRQLVIDSLSQKALGMFRWAVCQLDRLRRCFPASIRQALTELPRTLDETYERILLEIDEEKQVYAIRLLQCLAFSRRPLHVKELAEVLAIQFDTAIPRLNTSFCPGDADEAVLSACSTLVTTVELDDYDESDDYDTDSDHNYDPDMDYDHDYEYEYDDSDSDNGSTRIKSDSRIVQFSHYSVKEFLTSERLAKSAKGDISQYYISPEPAHTTLAQTCISTLLQPDVYVGDITDSFPFAKYAAQNWFHHAQCDGVAYQIQDGMERLFDPDKKHFALWISIHDIDHPWRRRSSKKTEASPLYYATLCGIGILVEHFVIRRRQDPNQSRGNQGTPLHVAVISGHTGIAQLLLEHAADVNSRNTTSRTPLHEAVIYGRLDVAQLLLSHGADINALDGEGSSPLYKAVRSQKLDAVEFLLKGNADVNIQNIYGSTLLHGVAIARSRNLGIAQLLISHGADVNALDRQRNSPLHVAVQFQTPDVVELLLKGGAGVNIRDGYDSTPLHEAVKIGNLDIAQLLISHGADVNALDRQSNFPLLVAVQFQTPDVVELLLKGGTDGNFRDGYDSLPLHKAIEIGNLDIAQLLISHGADLCALRGSGTLLHDAVQSQKYDVVEFLLKGGADVNIQNISDLLHEAVGSGNLDIAQLLIGHGAYVNDLDRQSDPLLYEAVRSQKHDVVELLLKGGADVNIRNIYDLTPLHEAVRSGDLNIAQLLISHGADVNALDDQGNSPVYIAVQSNNLDVVELLLKGGADVKIRNISSLAPLHEAVKSGDLNIAQLLISHGADVNALDDHGNSPVSYAVRSQKHDVVELLLKCGADVNIRNIFNLAPLDEAVKSGDFNIAQLLISHGAYANAALMLSKARAYRVGCQ